MKPKMNMGKKFQMDVVRDEKDNAILNKIAKKEQNVLNPNQVKPSFTASSPGMRKRESAQNIPQNSYLGSNLNSGDKGMNRNESYTSVGSAQKVGKNIVAPQQLLQKTK